MPLPTPLRSLVHDPEFWSDFLGEELYQKDYPPLIDPTITHEFPVRIDLPVTAEYELTLLKTSFLGGFFLELAEVQRRRATTVAYNGLDGHPFPHGLRWEEVDLFGRCLAQRDPDWSHPGVAVLFMSLAAPVTSQEDAGVAFPLLEKAWTSLGIFTERRLARLIRSRDYRQSGMNWQFQEPHGWVLRNAHTLRQVNSGMPRFPFTEWNRFLAAGTAVSPDPSGLPNNASALTLIPGPEPAHRLEVQFPADADERMVAEFKRVVFEEGVGQTYWQGGVCFPPTEGPMPDNAFDTTIFGDLDEGLGVIRQVFAKFGPPPGTGIWSWTERRHLPASVTAG